MQTDKQKLTRLAVNIKQLEEQMSRKGVALNSGVLVDSSDEEDCRDECSGKGTFHSQMSKTLKQYEFRKQFNETWYKQKMEALYRTYNRGTFEVE